MLADKDNLEDAVRKQHDLIEKQTEELRQLKKQLEERDGQLDKSRWEVAGREGGCGPRRGARWLPGGGEGRPAGTPLAPASRALVNGR